MSNLTVSLNYAAALAAIKMNKDGGVLDLTADDFDFLTSEGAYEGKLWLPIDRSRSRRCVEAAVYGALDMLGYSRFSVPVEYIAAVIALYVSPVNTMTACVIMEGAEYVDSIVQGQQQTISASQLFAHVLRLRGGQNDHLSARERVVNGDAAIVRDPNATQGI